MEFGKAVRNRLRGWKAEVSTRLSADVGDLSNVRPLVCARAAVSCVAFGVFFQAQANVSYVSQASAIKGSDQINWATVGFDGSTVFNPTSGSSKKGLLFRAAKPTAGAMRIDQELADGRKELCLNSQNSSTISIEFDRPVAAAGADVVISDAAFSSVSIRALDAYGAVIMQTTEGHYPGNLELSQYMGVVATGESIKTIEYSVDSGVISVGKIDLRPMSSASDILEGGASQVFSSAANAEVSATLPVDRTAARVSDQLYTVAKNGATLIATPGVLAGSTNAASAKLVSGPIHASYFRFYPDGSFEYRPAKDYFGADEFRFLGASNSGLESLPARARVQVQWVNSAPSFKAGGDISCAEDAGPQSISKWATDISAGGPDEANQQLTWQITSETPELFSKQPALAADGTLTFEPKAHTFGSSLVTAVLRDNGGTMNGGQDASLPFTFSITVAPKLARPSLFVPSEASVVPGTQLSVRASASGQGEFEYLLVNQPKGMLVDSSTGLITWTPSMAEAGKAYQVTVEARSIENPANQDRKVMILDVRSAPHSDRYIASVGRKMTVAVPGWTKGPYYLLGSIASGGTVDSDTGLFTWTPSPRDAGRTVEFFVSTYESETMRAVPLASFKVAVADLHTGRSAQRLSTPRKPSPTGVTALSLRRVWVE